MFQPIHVILRDGQLQRNTFMVNVVKDVHKYSYYTVLCDKIMLKCIKYKPIYISLQLCAKISEEHLRQNWHLHSKGVIS
jgi:hypothetical protein